MNGMWSNEKLKVFVKDTLGCGCPDKVFERIVVSKIEIETHAEEIIRIVVGDTLLVYIVRHLSADKSVGSVEAVGSTGRVDRDANNYNRFRLVLTGIEGSAQKDKITECFSKTFDEDEKMHIHFVDESFIAGLH